MDLLEKAKEAINEVFSDRSASKQETIEAMEELSEHADSMATCLREELESEE